MVSSSCICEYPCNLGVWSGDYSTLVVLLERLMSGIHASITLAFADVRYLVRQLSLNGHWMISNGPEPLVWKKYIQPGCARSTPFVQRLQQFCDAFLPDEEIIQNILLHRCPTLAKGFFRYLSRSRTPMADFTNPDATRVVDSGRGT